MFPILQGCLQKEVFPQQTVCADVDIVTGIFYRCPKVSGKGRAIGDTGGYAPPFGIEIRCKIAVGQMKTKFIPPVHDVFAGGYIIILEVVVDRIFAFGIGLVHLAAGILGAYGNCRPSFAFFQRTHFQVKVPVFLIMSDMAIVVNPLQYGTDIRYFYPREGGDGQKMVGRVEFLSFILVGVRKKFLIQEEETDTGFSLCRHFRRGHVDHAGNARILLRPQYRNAAHHDKEANQ